MATSTDRYADASRPDVDIAAAMQTEMQVLAKALSVDSLAKSLQVHPGLSSVPQYATLLDKLREQCAISRVAADFHNATSNIGLTVGDVMSALLTAVSHAYAFTPANVPNTTHEHLAAISPQLPMWCDAQQFNQAFQALDSLSQRTLDARPVDLKTVEHAIEILRDIGDTCGELLSASTTVKPTSTWETTTQLAWNFGPTMLFSPPPTPEQANSPTPPRKRNITPLASATSRAAKAAFESAAPDNHVPTPNTANIANNNGVNSLVNAAVNAVPVQTAPRLQNMFFAPYLVDDDPLQQLMGPNPMAQEHQVVPPSPTRRGGGGPRMAPIEDEWGGLQFKERPPGFRVVMCRHMDAKGKCKKAGTCTFAHTQADLEKFRALYIPTERCNFGAKCGKTACRYSHSPAEQHRAIRIYVQNCIAAVKNAQ